MAFLDFGDHAGSIVGMNDCFSNLKGHRFLLSTDRSATHFAEKAIALAALSGA
jgi:hypothetical protein